MAIPMLLAGCVSHEQIDLTGKECPCGGEFTCDESSNTCRRSAGGGGGGDAGPRSDAGPRPDTGGGETDAGPGVDAGMMMMMDMGTIVLEAEAGDIEAPMQTGTEATASGGSYVEVMPGTAASGAMAPATGKVTFTFDVPDGEAGTFRVWGRVIAPGESNDSFWVRIDGDATWYQWNELALPAARTAWEWDDVHNTEMAGVNTPVTWDLVAGSHTLDIAYREPGAQLDKVVITNDTALTPMGPDGI